MRPTLLAACLLTLATGTVRAGTKTPDLSSHECGLSSPYNMQVDDAGVRLYRHGAAPKEIFFHDGALRVDHAAQAVSAADAQRLRQMEDDTRALVPEVAGIAREAVDITFDALVGVTEAMTGSKRKARKIERYRENALAHVDGSLGKGRWDQDAFDEKFEADVEQVANEMADSISRSVLWAVFTGRAHRIEQRADRMDEQLDKLVEARSLALENRAKALCPRITALRDLQEALEYRYDGAPLKMLEPSSSTPAEATAQADVAGAK